MMNLERGGEPMLLPIKVGWSAHSDGWAVHAPTKDDVINAFRERVALYQRIDERPYIGAMKKQKEARPNEPLS